MIPLAKRPCSNSTRESIPPAQSRQIAFQRAALASQGGDVDSGSPLDIVGDTARAGYTDAATLRSNAAQKAYNYEIQANDAAGSANDDTFQAANATANLPYTIGSSLLGSASGIAGRARDWFKS